jgi:hypothetical protein
MNILATIALALSVNQGVEQIAADNLIKQLSSQKGKVREVAAKNLIRIGEPCLARMHALRKKTDSLDLRVRLERTIREVSAPLVEEQAQQCKKYTCSIRFEGQQFGFTGTLVKTNAQFSYIICSLDRLNNMVGWGNETDQKEPRLYVTVGVDEYEGHRVNTLEEKGLALIMIAKGNLPCPVLSEAELVFEQDVCIVGNDYWNGKFSKLCKYYPENPFRLIGHQLILGYNLLGSGIYTIGEDCSVKLSAIFADTSNNVHYFGNVADIKEILKRAEEK